MNPDWLIKNTKESNGFVARRVISITYLAVCFIFGNAYSKHYRIKNRLIGQVLTPIMILKEELVKRYR